MPFLSRPLPCPLTDFAARAASREPPPQWAAPEVLRGEPASTASDVFSFGILLHELFSRAEPYAGEPPSVVIELSDPQLWPPRRPWGRGPPQKGLFPDEFASLVERCTRPVPAERPSFAAIAAELHGLDVPTLTETMMAKAAEGRRTSTLLHEIFPPAVALALKEGRVVEPQQFESVTIFLCDIVGYTALSSSLSAHLVTDMLSRLYTAFDRLVLKHGLFKGAAADVFSCAFKDS